ncbi:MAG: methionyl-tRNA formyltransferase [Desulfobacterales bacterium]|nr:methionyl-tRNA formyltransferase [Desulfobacterales bacterium]
MRIIYIGTVAFSKAMLETLLRCGANIVGVVTQSDSLINSDFVDLSISCKTNTIPFIYSTNVNDVHEINWIRNLNPDIICCFGWSRKLNSEVLQCAKLGTIGFHPAKLPQNRGRHPIIWALALGLNETASTFFFMNEQIDAGDILSQQDILIEYKDTAETLYQKIIYTAERQVQEFFPTLINKSYKRIPQDDHHTNYWRKRSYRDGKIDFRMSSRSIYNLVRALSHPYPGAYVSWRQKDVHIWKVEEVNIDMPNTEPGKVIDSYDSSILVKTGDGGILITHHGFEKLPLKGTYFL